MHVLNRIAYAGEPEPGMKVDSAKVVNDLSMFVTFSTGETRLFDASQLAEKPAFSSLANFGVFQDFQIDYGVVTWAQGDIGIAPEAMYKMSFPYEKIA